MIGIGACCARAQDGHEGGTQMSDDGCVELATLQGEHESLCRTLSDTMAATASAFGTLADERREQHAKLDDLKVAVTKLSSTEPHGRSADFKFAREKDGGAEVVDLPNFLLRRTVN